MATPPTTSRPSGALAHVVKSSTVGNHVHLSREEHETLKSMDRQIAKITANKEAAAAFLKRAGITTSHGNLSPKFRLVKNG